MTAWQAFLAGGTNRTAEEVRNREATLDFDDAINIQYTSGTTGAPKGATLSHHNILNNGYFVGMGCGYTAADRICVPVPLYHCFGMVMGNLAAVTHGASVIYPEVAFDPRATLDAVSAERCTSLYGVPTMFIAQLQHPEFPGFDLTSLRTGISAPGIGGLPRDSDPLPRRSLPLPAYEQPRHGERPPASRPVGA